MSGTNGYIQIKYYKIAYIILIGIYNVTLNNDEV